MVLHRGRCGDCGNEMEGRHPFQTSTARGAASHQLGPEALALATKLHFGEGLPFDKVREHLADLGLRVNTSTLVRAMERIAVRGHATFEALLAEVLSQDVLHIDETGWSVDGKPCWLWVISGLQATVYFVRETRGSCEVEDFLKDFAGVLVTDGAKAYDKLGKTLTRALCLLHLRRNVRALEASQTRGAVCVPRALDEWLGRVIELVSRRATTKPEEWQAESSELQKEFEQVFLGCKPTNEANRSMIERVVKWQDAILRCLRDERVPAIHRIGDLWLEHHDSARMAHASGKKSADEAIEARRRERAEKKAAKKAEAAKKKAARAEAIATRRATDVIFLGEGVSSQLHDRRAEIERLEAFGLPVIVTPEQLAAHLGVTVPRLRWLAFHQEAAQTTHYVQFEVPKRTGGTRVLAAPKPDIAAAQTKILETILAKLPLDEAAHGFVTGRSTVSNARPHQGRDLVINLDLSDFFPSVTFPRVRGVFRSFGYSPAVATILALLCTESPRRTLSYDGRTYQVAVGPRALPQGACTSPALSNLVARKLDRRLRGLATKHGLTYTRYADDLTFSAGSEKRSELGMMLARMRHVIEDEGFALNPKKVRVQRKGGRQTVTGIVVNEPTKLGLPRTEVRRLRAILHAARTHGLQSQNRENHPDFRAHLAGKIAYLAMIDPARAKPLREALDACRS